jgi:hypothetical protein
VVIGSAVERKALAHWPHGPRADSFSYSKLQRRRDDISVRAVFALATKEDILSTTVLGRSVVGSPWRSNPDHESAWHARKEYL